MIHQNTCLHIIHIALPVNGLFCIISIYFCSPVAKQPMTFVETSREPTEFGFPLDHREFISRFEQNGKVEYFFRNSLAHATYIKSYIFTVNTYKCTFESQLKASNLLSLGDHV